MSDAQPAGGPWTGHGHAIEGITVEGSGRPPVARCGGPAICSKCAVDAERIRREASPELTAPAEQGPDDGHTFRFICRSRMSSTVDRETWSDADWWGPPLVYEVRAWDLPQALRVASTVPVASWFEGALTEELDSEKARSIAVQLENRLAQAAAVYVPSMWDRDELNDLLEDNPVGLLDHAVALEEALRLILAALQPDVYDEAKPAHYAEAFRQDASGRFGWQCLVCGAEEYAEDAVAAELMAGWHNEGRLFVVDGLVLLWPEGGKPSDGYPVCPACGHDFGGHMAGDISCPTCFNAGTPCTVDHAAVFAAIDKLRRPGAGDAVHTEPAPNPQYGEPFHGSH